MTRLFRRWRLWGFILLAPLAACTKTVHVPGPAVEVMVPLPVPCEIQQVPVPSYPAAQATAGMGIWPLAKIVAADRRVRMGENERLRAANNNPCPVEVQ